MKVESDHFHDMIKDLLISYRPEPVPGMKRPEYAPLKPLSTKANCNYLYEIVAGYVISQTRERATN